MSLNTRSLGICCAMTSLTAVAGPVLAYEFLEKRECTLFSRERPALHTTCIVDGGMQGGTIDVGVKTPDGKMYPIEGPVDGEDGSKYLLQNSPATFRESAPGESCFERNDGLFGICLENEID
jgi:hypothetical protein